LELYSFFNSSTSYRVRIALALKGLDYATHAVNLRTLQQRSDAYLELNPGGCVPTLRTDEGLELGQSLAIIDYLDALQPQPRLIPDAQPLRARVLEFAYSIACDIHPVNNLRILRYLQDLGADEAEKAAWYRHWIDLGMTTLDELLRRADAGPYCFGDVPTLADVCLVPQVANALRMKCDLSRFQRVLAVNAHCQQHPAFQAAEPSRQPDYVA
jgi:maleylacetoacetate isomerase